MDIVAKGLDLLVLLLDIVAKGLDLIVLLLEAEEDVLYRGRAHHACSREHRQPLRRNGAALRPASLGGRAWRGRDTRVDGTGDRGAGTNATLCTSWKKA